MTIPRRALYLALLGATLGTLLDYTHARTGAIVYPHPSRLLIPWWVPLLYLCSSLAIGLSHPLADRWLRRRARAPHTPLQLFAGFAGLCAIWVASGALPLASWVVALILAPASLALWFWLDRTWQGLLIAATTAATGCAVEVVLSRAGLFSHAHPDILGVAVWLPWIYVAASVGLGNVGRALEPDPAVRGVRSRGDASRALPGR